MRHRRKEQAEKPPNKVASYLLCDTRAKTIPFLFTCFPCATLDPSIPPSLRHIALIGANSDRSAVRLGRVRHNSSRVLARKSTYVTTTRRPASTLVGQKRRSSTSGKMRSASGTAADWTSPRYGSIVALKYTTTVYNTRVRVGSNVAK